MIFSVGKKSTAAAAAVVAAGFSALFLWASPASAAPAECGVSGTLLAGNICEQTFSTTGPAVFTPNAQMSQLQVLLVAGGGTGADQTNSGYAAGGGGGEVKVVDFSGDTSTPLNLVVGDSGQASSAAEGTAPAIQAAPGGTAPDNSGSGAASGNGNAGWVGSYPADTHGGGGGAGAVGSDYNGGDGATPASVASPGSLFSNDTICYGGGGAVGVHASTMGTATCGGGHPVDGASAATLIAPTPNSGGGGGGVTTTTDAALRNGASGVVVVRWNAATAVTLTFASNGHGASVAPESLFVGDTPTKPADPTAQGFVFNGWYTNAALTTKADFSAPVTASTTFYASWSPVLALTGGGPTPLEMPLGVAALGIGLGLFVVGSRRTRKAN